MCVCVCVCAGSTNFMFLLGYVVKSLKERYNECQMQEETRGRLTLVGDIMLGLVSTPHKHLFCHT